MSKPVRKRFWVLVALLLLLPFATYWLADTWLESSGGRQMLEQVLSERMGMPVRLTGEFDLMLLPAIGVSGTGLVIGGPDPEPVFVSSEKFEISVALKPLLDRRVVVEWIRVTGGSVNPQHYAPSGNQAVTAGAASAAKFSVPEIRELSIREFQIILPGEFDPSLKVREFTVSGFAENQETPFALRLDEFGAVDGSLRWDPSQSRVLFRNLQLDLAGQGIAGDGCLFTQDPVALHFELRADEVDLDALRRGLPDFPGAGDGSDEQSLEIRVRFSVEEMRTGATVARGVDIVLGGEPTCDS